MFPSAHCAVDGGGNRSGHLHFRQNPRMVVHQVKQIANWLIHACAARLPVMAKG